MSKTYNSSGIITTPPFQGFEIPTMSWTNNWRVTSMSFCESRLPGYIKKHIFHVYHSFPQALPCFGIRPRTIKDLSPHPLSSDRAKLRQKDPCVPQHHTAAHPQHGGTCAGGKPGWTLLLASNYPWWRTRSL